MQPSQRAVRYSTRHLLSQCGLKTQEAARAAVARKGLAFLPDARHFDMGERDHFISMELATIGMEMMAEWGSDAMRRTATRCAASGERKSPARPLPAWVTAKLTSPRRLFLPPPSV